MAAELLKAADIINDTRNLDVPTVTLYYERVRNLFYEGLHLFSPNAVVFAGRLEPVQINSFQKEFDKKMRDLKQEDSEIQSFKKMRKHFESWMGSLNSSQKKDLEKFVENNPSNINEKIYNRQYLAHEFVRSYPDKNARAVFVDGLFSRYESMREPGYSKIALAKDKKIILLVTSILNKMSDSQREDLVETLRERANQLLKISRG